MEGALNLKTQYLEIIGLSIGEPILGLIAREILLVGVKDTIAAEPTNLRDTHQQQQKQQILLESP
jgi:hypothetical protein